MSYFRVLVDDELALIARFLSSTPKDDDWQTNLYKDAALLLLDEHGPFQTVSHLLFPVISVNADGGLIVTSEFAINSTWAPRIGSNVTHLITTHVSDPFCNAVFKYCTNLRSLTLDLDEQNCARLDLGHILTLSDKLECIAIQGYTRNTPCALDDDTVLRLKSVTLFECRAANYTPIIKASAASLEHICLVGARTEIMSIFELVCTSAICRKLQHISSIGISTREDVSLLVALGQQRESAVITDTDYGLRVNVLRSCPTLAWDTAWKSLSTNPTYTLLAPHLSSLEYEYEGILRENHDFEGLRAWASMCRNLTSLSWASQMTNPDGLMSVFPDSKSQLTQLNLHLPRLVLTSDILHRIAIATSGSNLRDLKMRVSQLELNDSFGCIVGMWHKLEQARIIFTQPSKQDDVLNMCMLFRNAFRNHNHLKSLTFTLPFIPPPKEDQDIRSSFQAAISSIMEFYRLKRIRVQVNNVECVE